MPGAITARVPSLVASLGLAVLFLALAGCVGPASRPDTQSTVAIYSAVIRRACGPDDTAGGQLPKPVIYIVRVTDDRAGDPARKAGVETTLPLDVQAGVTAALSDLKSEIKWVDSFDAVKRNPDTGEVSGGGVIVRLGNIKTVAPQQVRVPASIYFAPMGAGGSTYVLRKSDGVWDIVRTASEWVS